MDWTTRTIGSESRAMFYSHDTYGLGHLRRTLTLVNQFAAKVPGISQLVVSGSPSAHRFSLPPRTDIIKLPSVTKDGNGQYMSRSLDIELEALRNARRDILVSTAHHFQPDFLVVDHSPAGMKGEVVATLRHLREVAPDTRLVLGLRDILDDSATVRTQWARDGVYELLNDVYDLIMVYGKRETYDVVSQYGFSAKAEGKTRYVGYLGRDAGKRTRAEIRSSLNMQTSNLVLVTAGGGGDGKRMFEAVLRDLRMAPDANEMDVLIVGGSLMAESDRNALQQQVNRTPNTHYLDFTDDLTSYIGAADVVVSMGGYNSVCEILALGRKGIIVPRVLPRQEQLIRAEILSRMGYIEMLHPQDLTPMRLLNQIRELLAQPDRPIPALEMNGLDNVISAIDSLWPIRRTETA